MAPDAHVSPVMCPRCGGDPRASVGCRECQGAGLSLPSQDGQLVWLAPIDDFSLAFRKTKHRIHVLLHAGLGGVVVVLFSLFVYGLVRLDDADALLSATFWTSGYWFVQAFWAAVFLGSFLVFRLRVFREEVKTLPHWGMRSGVSEVPNEAPAHAHDVSPYFLSSAWQVIEDAYGFAKKVGRTELVPAHLFVAALTSPTGGIFLTRLAMPFEAVKDRLVALLREGQVGTPTRLSREAKEVLLRAYLDARTVGRKHVSAVEIFLAAYAADQGVQDALDAAGFPPAHVQHVAEWLRIQEQLREEHDRFALLARLKPDTAMNRTMTARQTPLLDRFSEDLTHAARRGYIGPMVGRHREREELFRAFESGKSGIVLVGESGVGKTALVEQLARAMVEETVPKILFDKRLVSIKLPELLASGDPAEAPERLLTMLREVGISGNIVLVLEGIEALTGGHGMGPMDLAETLATELDRGSVQVLATTTPEAWTSFLERRSLGGKLAKILVRELPSDEAVQVLMARSGSIEYEQNVFFSYAALERAVFFAGKYLRDVRLPESAIGLMKEAAVLARKAHGDGAFVTGEDVAQVVQEKTQIPVEAVGVDESAKLLALEERLHARVIGQEEAVQAVAAAMRRARAEVRETRRPIANFLFLGPTGVGKTELAKALAAEYFGSEQAMVRLDMSEYQDAASIARMIGAAGDPRGGLLTEAVRKRPFAIVLLDELEKAHPDILTLFLQVMDDGRLTDGVGRTVDFTNVVLIATSNAGTAFIQDRVRSGAPVEQIKTALLEQELKGTFRPEFLNRFDGVIVFTPLALSSVVQIAHLLLAKMEARLAEKGIGFRADASAVEELARAGFDPLFGARPLRRVLQDRIENQLADLLLKKAVARKDTIVLDAGGTLRVEPFHG